MYKFSVWVDADSFPAKARSFLVSYSSSKSVRVYFVANHEIKDPLQQAEMILCQKEANAADNYIFEHAGENDIVVTRDIPFAARLVEKKIEVMNDRGLVFSKDNIEDKLREREFSLNLAGIGFGGDKGNYYGQKELDKFSRTFEQKLQEHIMNETYNIKRR
ncbi:MAG: DUF188 domain-containing protein [Treponema sp.]|nr:DUF188 domain-containing protein [Treponema sp.]